ncbi:MAG TPA: hypothetical protein PK529_05860 [Verrucomicrobiales bacterium]|nr:hypothetical protein [Verrucomicrobiales bacterium]
MKKISQISLLALALTPLLLCSCVDPSTGLSSSLSPGSSPVPVTTPSPVEEHLTKHDVALRFLTAYIRLDRAMALRYATPEAVSKLNWNLSHRGNIPYYNDNMLLQFNGGWARVFFQDMGGTYKITDLEVHSN